MQNLVNVRDFFDPAHDGDWTLAFKKAIAASVAGGNGGVFVPADKSPYTVVQPGHQMPSIDLRGRRNFTLMGEGYGSVIQMTGPGGGSWFMIHIGGHAENITVRDLFLDGNRTGLAHPDDQTHLIKIGGSNSAPGGAVGIKILDCTLTRAVGDGIAILPTGASASSGEEVSDVRIAFCSFTGNGRSGISNQRSTRLVQILHNHFEGNGDQDIDFEPTGNTPGSGPSGYLIFGNSIVHGNATVAVTLSGVSGSIPASGNTFAGNQIRGGTLGLVHARDTLITGNYIEAGLTSPGPVVRLTGRVEGVRFADNHVLRPAGAQPGQLLELSGRTLVITLAGAGAIDAAADEFRLPGHGFDTGTGPMQVTKGTPAAVLPAGLSLHTNYWAIRVSDDALQLAATRADAMAGRAVDITDNGTPPLNLTRVVFPRGTDVHDNRFHTYVPVSAAPAAADGATVTFTNAQESSFRNNEVHSYADAVIPNAVRFDATAAMFTTVQGWDITGNRFGGQASQDDADVFTNAIMLRPAGVAVENIQVNFNNFMRCTNQTFFTAGAGGTYRTVPMSIGNDGSGVP
jgi:hypothetical protein